MKRITHLIIAAVILLTLMAFAGSSRSVAGDTVRVPVESLSAAGVPTRMPLATNAGRSSKGIRLRST